jgi:hypothetical protein
MKTDRLTQILERLAVESVEAIVNWRSELIRLAAAYTGRSTEDVDKWLSTMLKIDQIKILLYLRDEIRSGTLKGDLS